MTFQTLPSGSLLSSFRKQSKLLRTTALVLLFSIVSEIIIPTTAYALGGGPGAIDYASFEPVGTTDMVNVFTGEFNYNLPVLEVPSPDGDGYGLALSYHSGTNAETEASWVGYGFSLNAGAVSRATRNLPDEYKGDNITQYNKVRANWTSSIKEAINAEVVSMDMPDLNIGTSTSLRFNNYMGFSRSNGLGVSLKGLGGINMNTSAEGTTFSANVNVMGILSKSYKDHSRAENRGKKLEGKDLKAKSLATRATNRLLQGLNSLGSTYAVHNLSSSAPKPSYDQPYSGLGLNYDVGLSLDPGPVPIGLQAGYLGSINMQWNIPTYDMKAYGYMNNPTEGNKNTASDYYVDKPTPYDKRDFLLSPAFGSPDNFIVTGQGLGGGFKFFPEANPLFFPAQNTSAMPIVQVGTELQIGGAIGVGVDVGGGYQKTTAGKWSGGINDNELVATNTNGVFRFNGDMGGTVGYTSSEDFSKLGTATLNKISKLPGAKKALINSDPSFTGLNHTGSSSFIKPISSASSKLEGFSIWNEEGKNYIYGLPVYTRNESSLIFDIAPEQRPGNKYIAQKATYLNSSYDVNTKAHKTVKGEVKKSPYATAMLLTEIRSPQYVDVNGNGVDAGDFGGYTKFGYTKAYGNANERKKDDTWYRYRAPYTGLLYQAGQLSDTKDDIGFVSTGEKEVYYLKTIETKTHIACFVTNKTQAADFADFPAKYVTGSGEERLDGRAAARLTGETDRASTGTKGTDAPERLEKIVLFSKGRKTKPVKSVHFAYDYSMVPNVPNNVNSKFPLDNTSLESGKLTLTKVWFEYEGTHSVKISPYEFKYAYKDKTDYAPEVASKYGSILDLNSNYSTKAQNPEYSPYLQDAWGNVQVYGEERHRDLNPWPYQGAYPASNINSNGSNWRSLIVDSQTAKSYDPGAWQLKQIILPGLGEILIQYEATDYSSVQDRSPMAMCSLLGVDEKGLQAPLYLSYSKDPEYTVNLADIGLKVEDVDAYVQTVNDYYGSDGGKQKVYFKFLYDIRQRSTPELVIPSINDCNSEYIEGYAKFKSCIKSTDASGNPSIKITLAGENSSDGEYTGVPRQACYDFAATQRIGKDFNDNCESEYETQYEGIIDVLVDNEESAVRNKLMQYDMAGTILSTMAADIQAAKYKIPKKGTVCTSINPSLSYIKLPMITAKRGGGARVKRLLMYDDGLETGDAVLYGNEYVYKTEDGKSSGVATNEPSSMREENPLVTFLPKKDQSWYNRITAGQDKEQTEGPIGESLLPEPSIGHSRVVVKNIHTGKTGKGYTVHEFNTAKDYPYDKDYGIGKGVEFSNLSDNKLNDPMLLPLGLFNYSMNKSWMAQGFKFILTAMHGQPKKTSAYGGNPDDPSKNWLISSQSYNYFEPGEKIKMLDYKNGAYSMTEEVPGSEMEVTREERATYASAFDLAVEIDITIGLIPTPPVYCTLTPSIGISDDFLKTYTTSKVIRYPAIVKSVTNFQDGVLQEKENVAFNKHNGQPIITRTESAYDKVLTKTGAIDGSLYSVTLPASWYYEGMGQKALNEASTNQLNVNAGMLTTFGKEGNPLNTGWFENPKSVTSANIQTFKKDWSSSWSDANSNSATHATALNKIWRPLASYNFKSDAITTGLVYNAGAYDSFKMYFKDPANAKWIKTSEVSKYNPHGNALSSTDILGIASSTLYNESGLVSMEAAAADNGEIYFDGFETGFNLNQEGHTGKTSKAGAYPYAFTITGGQKLKSKGGLLRLWLKEPEGNTAPVNINVIYSTGQTMEKVVQTGEWTLYKAEIPASAFTSGQPVDFMLLFGSPTTGTYSIDDLRFEPMNTKSICYVYDMATLKLSAVLDEQHFALYYEYNGEGKLVRKSVETERGKKTISETQYNLVKVKR